MTMQMDLNPMRRQRMKRGFAAVNFSVEREHQDGRAMQTNGGRRGSFRVPGLLLAGAVALYLVNPDSALAQPQGPPPGGASEAKQAGPDPLVAAAARWDANHDGVLTCDEWKLYANRLFNFADKNNDGFLDAKEFQQLGKIEPTFADADIPYFDENQDKRVSRKEFVDKPNPLFSRYDTNRDCRVTAEEIKAAGRPARDNDARPPGGGGPGGPMGRSGP